MVVAPLPLMMLKPVPERVTWVTSTAAVPVLVAVMLWVAVLPTVTFPKLRLVALGVSTPVLGEPVSTVFAALV